MLAGATLVSLAATLPLALSHTRRAEAGGLIVAHERASVLDALRTPDLLAVRSADASGDEARLATDGREDTAWTGRAGETRWKWAAAFAKPVHVGLVRARFGSSPTSGVPTVFHWEVRPPVAGPTSRGRSCEPLPPTSDDGWTVLEGAGQLPSPAADLLAQPTRRSFDVDVDACGLRLVIDRTNAGLPVVRDVQALAAAVDVLQGAEASDDGAYPGFSAGDAVDGTYTHRWAGAPGRSRWTLRVDLPEAQSIDRVRLVLGFDATSVPRPGWGRSYAIS